MMPPVTDCMGPQSASPARASSGDQSSSRRTTSASLGSRTATSVRKTGRTAARNVDSTNAEVWA